MQSKENGKAFYANSLNLIRLIAAMQVMYGHITAHLHIDMPEWISETISFFYGVPIFFGLSGYLVWRSLEKSSGFREYSLKRALRIFPELWVAVIIELAAILLTYDKSGGGGILLLVFGVCQSTVLQFWTPDFLRGYGCGTPNGALWTIGVIIQSYIVLYVVYKWIRNKNWKWWLGLLVGSMGLTIALPVLQSKLPTILSKLVGQTFLPYIWIFLLGAMLSRFFEHIIPFLKKWWFVFLALSLICVITGFDINHNYYGIIRCSTLIVGLIGFAYAFPKIRVWQDISYPLYLYHMTVVNVMIQLGYTGKRIDLLIAIIVSCVIAFISTNTVGRLTGSVKVKLKSK